MRSPVGFVWSQFWGDPFGSKKQTSFKGKKKKRNPYPEEVQDRDEDQGIDGLSDGDFCRVRSLVARP